MYRISRALDTISTHRSIPKSRHLSTSTAKMVVQRITMFKVNEEADIQKMIDQYKAVAETNKKVRIPISAHDRRQLRPSHQDGKPYILACTAYKPINDPRTQGYNLLAYTTFASQEDVKYYDEKCEAHQGVKDLAKGKIQPPPLVAMWETS